MDAPSLTNILLDAAALVAAGWIQHSMIRETTGDSPEGCAIRVCAWGGIRLAAGGQIQRFVHFGPDIALPVRHLDNEQSMWAATACSIVAREFEVVREGKDYGEQSLISWNDKACRKQGEVTALLRMTALVCAEVADPIYDIKDDNDRPVSVSMHTEQKWLDDMMRAAARHAVARAGVLA